MKIKIVKPRIWNFEVLKGKDAWKEVVEAARVSGVPSKMKEKEVFEMIVRNDYTSAVEHILIKFDIQMTKGIAPEFLEHRIVSHTGFSTRYRKVAQPFYEIILPWHLLKNKEKRRIFLEKVKENLKIYENFLKEGLPKESARYILPFCQAVGIYHVTINLRSLLNLLSLRLCVRASPEFRCLASQIYFALIKKLPIMRGMVGCRGLMRGACPEDKARERTFCPFKDKTKDFFIPTIPEMRKGKFKTFNLKKAIEIQEKMFKVWARWEG